MSWPVSQLEVPSFAPKSEPDLQVAPYTEGKTIKTRICMISDTHSTPLFGPGNTNFAFREPLPKADVLLHAGDLTSLGYLSEYEETFKVIHKADAELKIVIAGNHDVTLDEPFYEKALTRKRFHRGFAEDVEAVRELWTGEDARKAGIVYLDEGYRTFDLRNGAKLSVRSFIYRCEQM
jgi:predicted MPP superfamily phosphohydrolase